jgi:hypothetical protein
MATLAVAFLEGQNKRCKAIEGVGHMTTMSSFRLLSGYRGSNEASPQWVGHRVWQHSKAKLVNIARTTHLNLL